MKAYFDRTEPYYFSRKPTFDGNPVEVDEEVLEVLESRKTTLVEIEKHIELVGAPEETAQELADTFVALLKEEKSFG